MTLTSNQINIVTKLRHYLHQYPETAHNEKHTSRTIVDFLQEHHPPDKVKHVGGEGIIAIYEGNNKGPYTVFRAELDALPIHEKTDIQHQSRHEGKSHKCGHDGHMAILCGLALWLKKHKPEKGRIGLLFQPAEETGEGARKVLRDAGFNRDMPDYIYALHNLPGYKKGTIIYKKGVFASASTGFELKLKGRTSHAGHPENAVTPNFALAQLMHELPALPSRLIPFSRAALVTVINAQLGEIAYGTTPGYAELRATFRTHHDQDMELLRKNIPAFAENVAKAHGLTIEKKWKEPFPSSKNHDDCVETLKKAIQQNKLQAFEKQEPFPWSEDFGNFLLKIPGVLFGLGAGEKAPQLHNPDYDFPDDLIQKGTEAFSAIIDTIYSKKSK